MDQERAGALIADFTTVNKYIRDSWVRYVTNKFTKKSLFVEGQTPQLVAVQQHQIIFSLLHSSVKEAADSGLAGAGQAGEKYGTGTGNLSKTTRKFT